MGDVFVIEGEGRQHRRVDAKLRLDIPARELQRTASGSAPVRGVEAIIRDGPDDAAVAFQEVAQLRHAVGNFTRCERIHRTLPERTRAAEAEALVEKGRDRVAVGRSDLARANLGRSDPEVVN